ncbi:1-(5-phosphoribosyl)-5-[(5-phosphoribosylamino)methylideneamino]imidazole-4-carboxamide isomerase [Ornithinibacillus gellani]|uniref:1-(5-phosphoribosyl)-5-[(5- phosphoribosylamino)methylideneamino]imidazole-4- carboxamide isomerase n=1 Tax=Ornithinibacillus gellani TaxID=2293253 RepID=UPI000F4810B3|nr:1-(5-phosphoribosyl)-5-[(5-phosphoribosylamino)methylideneamino]imidazole-4-carboxamide isomerase [Ornithinibacillus gellani]TQS76491.1 1-(5-phosphoribosyl)-5-[(5-phosphoribosylamino)methylideneamino]imidazole-4-carboxamide isomerase [Ornithinibacillus gellani]
MILFPAIDIRDGKCVRLIQGDYSQEKIYGDSPVDMARKWESLGAEALHLVDLDGARTGNSLNENMVIDIASTLNIPVQVGGGIRTIQQIETYLNAGVARVILGTAAIKNEALLKQAVAAYGEKIAVSIDARNGLVATDGWTETSNMKALELIQKLEKLDIKTIVYTDILKDGMLSGPNIKELAAIQAATNIQVIASGGVTTITDIAQLRNLEMYGAIIGKALYDGTLKFESILEVNSNDI